MKKIPITIRHLDPELHQRARVLAMQEGYKSVGLWYNKILKKILGD